MVDYFNKGGVAPGDTVQPYNRTVAPTAENWNEYDTNWLNQQVGAGNQDVINQITAAMGGTTTVAAPPYTGTLPAYGDPNDASTWPQHQLDEFNRLAASGDPATLQAISAAGYPSQGYPYPQNPGASNPYMPQQPGAPNPYMPSGTTNEMVFPAGEDVKPYSGLPESYRDQLLGFLMPQLQSSIGNMEGNIDQYTQNALGTYRQEFNNYVDEEIPKMLRDLAKRGIIDSSVAENAISQTYSDALRKSSGMGYQTAMEAARMKAAIPQSIGGLLQYGQYQEDPTQMYKTLASLLAAQMP